MTLQIHNKQVIDFYKQNKHISFEEVNIFMVDMLQKMMQNDSLSPNLMNEMNKTLLCLQTKMESMTNDMSKLQQESQNQVIMKMMEMKDIYIDQLKYALTNNVSEKIQPILKEHTTMFIDKTHLLWNDMMPKNQEQTEKILYNVLRNRL